MKFKSKIISKNAFSLAEIIITFIIVSIIVVLSFPYITKRANFYCEWEENDNYLYLKNIKVETNEINKKMVVNGVFDDNLDNLDIPLHVNETGNNIAKISCIGESESHETVSSIDLIGEIGFSKDRNIVIGTYNLSKNNAGNNIIIGTDSFKELTSSYNIAIGNYIGQNIKENNKRISKNILIGNSILNKKNNSPIEENIIIGDECLYNIANLSQKNILIGHKAGKIISSPIKSQILIGNSSGEFIGTLSPDNILIGEQVAKNVTNVGSSIIIGKNALKGKERNTQNEFQFNNFQNINKVINLYAGGDNVDDKYHYKIFDNNLFFSDAVIINNAPIGYKIANIKKGLLIGGDLLTYPWQGYYNSNPIIIGRRNFDNKSTNSTANKNTVAYGPKFIIGFNNYNNGNKDTPNSKAYYDNESIVIGYEAQGGKADARAAYVGQLLSIGNKYYKTRNLGDNQIPYGTHIGYKTQRSGITIGSSLVDGDTSGVDKNDKFIIGDYIKIYNIKLVGTNLNQQQKNKYHTMEKVDYLIVDDYSYRTESNITNNIPNENRINRVKTAKNYHSPINPGKDAQLIVKNLHINNFFSHTDYKFNNDKNIYDSCINLATNEYLMAQLTLSDKNYKIIKKESLHGIEDIRKINIYKYKFKEDREKRQHIGVIAQEIEKILPNIVSKDKNTKLLSVDSNQIFFIGINAVKQLDNEIKNLDKTKDDINSRLDSLEKYINAKNKKVKKRNIYKEFVSYIINFVSMLV